MDRRIIPLIMCGGAGTRLWPASREVHPKQFLPLFGTRSTFQDTILRVSDPALFERPIVITNVAYRIMVLELLAEIGLEADVLLEPMRRDPGPPRIAAGVAFAQTRDADVVDCSACSPPITSSVMEASVDARCRAWPRRMPGRSVDVSAFNPNAPLPSTAISIRARSFPARSVQSRSSSKSPIRRPPPVTSRAGYFWNSGNWHVSGLRAAR